MGRILRTETLLEIRHGYPGSNKAAVAKQGMTKLHKQKQRPATKQHLSEKSRAGPLADRQLLSPVRKSWEMLEAGRWCWAHQVS